MRRSERDEWVRALRSGEFRQAKGQLRKPITWGDESGTVSVYGYCCLGVKCELDVRASRHGMVSDGQPFTSYGINGHLADAMPRDEVLQAWGLSDGQANLLAQLNDGESGYDPHTFAQIADWIEQNVPVEDDDTNTGDVDNPL